MIIRDAGCGTVDVSVTIAADLSHTGKERVTVKPIDACIADLVRALEEAGVRMRGSCCGHGTRDGAIILADCHVIVLPVAAHKGKLV